MDVDGLWTQKTALMRNDLFEPTSTRLLITLDVCEILRADITADETNIAFFWYGKIPSNSRFLTFY